MSGGVCTLRAKDAQRILLDEFGVRYELKGVYDLMHRLRLSCLKPRPRHEKSDPAALKTFKEETAPFCPRREARRRGPHAQGWPRPRARDVDGRGPHRPAGHAHDRLGVQGLASHGGQAGQVRLGVPVRGGRAGDVVVLIMDRTGWHKAKAL
ncbi:MAG: winged helix-turn-helix domain-containing protein [Phycisphaeraceae bacterium]|nr:winged helix-turn-helix domain-containing protein [Phycisphaerae bacterium]MBX3393405.1 winged helix-turn-helix domain-containing protein [Phycisphaeraceae bacterium]